MNSSSRILLRGCCGRPTLLRFKSTKPSRNTGTLFESASDFLSSMRWQAANALTSTLTPDERKQLLNRLDPPKPKQEAVLAKADEGLDMKHSIAEAVALARAQEAQKNQAQWEKQKDQIMKEAEEAAVARIEADLSIQKRRLAFEKWKGELENDKDVRDKEAKLADSGDTNVVNDAQVVPESAVVEEDDVHPVLGPCILDLGYKRIHVVSSEVLGSIAVWKKQRIYRHDRAKAMAKDKVNSMHLGLPGVIGLHENRAGQLSILDGQHRVGMFSILAEKVDEEGILDRILVEVYPEQEHHGENHAQELFLEVNKSQPIFEVDLPGGSCKDDDRMMLTEAAEKICGAFPEMFKPSQKCRKPHVNIDNLRDGLFAADVIARHKFKTSKALETWVLEQNGILAKKYEVDEKARESVSKSVLRKANAFKFYLGLESNWLDN